MYYDDGSSVDTFANEPNSYYSYDTSCATVDNDAICRDTVNYQLNGYHNGGDISTLSTGIGSPRSCTAA